MKGLTPGGRWHIVREWQGKTPEVRYLLLRDAKGYGDGTPLVVWCRRARDIAGHPMVVELTGDDLNVALRWLAADLDVTSEEVAP